MKKILLAVITAYSFTNLSGQIWHKKGLIALYPFDSPSMLVDSSLNQLNLGFSSGIIPASNRFGANLRSAYFPDFNNNGLGEAVGNQSHYPDSANPRSISLWMRVDQYPDVNSGAFFPFFYGARQVNRGCGIGITMAGKLIFAGYTDDINNQQPDVTSISSIPIGDWFHIGLTFDGDSAKIYINGILDAKEKKTWNTSAFGTAEFGRMGKTSGGPNNGGSLYYPFTGWMDDFRIYNRALNAKEVYKLSQDDFSDLPSVVELPSSMEDLREDNSSFLIAPNPFSDLVNIMTASTPGFIKVFSVEGKLVAEKENSSQIDLSHLETGYYLITYSTKGKETYQFIIKQKQ